MSTRNIEKRKLIDFDQSSPIEEVGTFTGTVTISWEKIGDK